MRIKQRYYSLAAIVCLLLLLTTKVKAQQTVKITSSGIGYLEYLPQGYKNNSNKYPVVISLHGIKERGTSSTDPAKVKAGVPKVANVGLPKYVKYGQEYPFILISPQLKSSYGTWPASYVMEVINYVKTKLRIDNRRIYLTGLSLGGYGVWKTAGAYPGVFAAIAPVCSGGNDLGNACDIASNDVATWAFHGDKDGTVSYQVSLKMVNAINNCSPHPNPRAKITLYPGLSHIIWDKAYKETNVLDWMLGFTNGSGSTTPSNDSPAVSAGGDKTITLPTNHVYLQGSASDSDGSIASYKWSKVSGSTAGMSGTTSSKLKAYNLASGTYSFRLTVKDNKGASRYDDVKVTVKSSGGSNKAPVVSAGSDQSTTRNAITIVGSASDSDGDIKSYKWTKISGGSAGMSNATTRKLWAYNLNSGTYVFRLTVNDNDGATKYDDMKLTVKSSSSTANKPPVVSAGSDQYATRDAITIVGSASDPDGFVESYKWTKISGASAGMSNTTSRKLWAYNLNSGTYVFRLTVKDNDGATRYDDMKLTVKASSSAGSSPADDNKLPVVTAGNDQNTTRSAITIVGSASDPDGSVASYKWTKISGGSVSMSNTTTRKLWAYNLNPGTYVFRITVKDNDGASRYDDMKLTVKSSSVSSNESPDVTAGSDQTLILPRSGITIVGSAADEDGSIVSYKWSKISGGSVSMDNVFTRKLWASDLDPGTYTFRLTVKDNDGSVEYDDMKLYVKSS